MTRRSRIEDPLSPSFRKKSPALTLIVIAVCIATAIASQTKNPKASKSTTSVIVKPTPQKQVRTATQTALPMPQPKKAPKRAAPHTMTQQPRQPVVALRRSQPAEPQANMVTFGYQMKIPPSLQKNMMSSSLYRINPNMPAVTATPAISLWDKEKAFVDARKRSDREIERKTAMEASRKAAQKREEQKLDQVQLEHLHRYLTEQNTRNGTMQPFPSHLRYHWSYYRIKPSSKKLH